MDNTDGSLVGTVLDEDSRALIERVITRLTPELSRLSEQTFGLAKWLLASLLAVNGGALAAFLSRDSLDSGLAAAACGCWVIGLAMAICSGLSSYFRGMRGASIISTMLVHMEASLIRGVATMDFEKAASKISRSLRIPVALGAGSLALFVVGSAIAAFAIAA